ncbi:MAG: flagellar hook-associated protein FlgK [Deltaproteobacteria bacterium]|nr:flagellar hook-associated protein FlgK [Deltaproteobacteria bacterium]MBI3293995.1 flagellar hook-associated protein FlgK [Deltaproteobacteria bacterium]
MAINDIFDIGRQGIEANRRALTTTSQNVANANTPGYSRQRAVFQSDARSATGGVMLGGGVKIEKVMRIHNDFVQGQIMEEAKNHGGLRARSEGLMRIEGQVNERGRDLAERVNNFFNAFRELSTNPEQATLKLNAANAAEDVARSFRSVIQSLETLKNEADLNLMGQVGGVNQLTREVATLNEQIALNQAVRGEPNELLDRREEILRQLSGKVGFQTYYDDRGMATIVSGTAVLVQGTQANELEAVRSAARGTKTEGSVEIMMVDRMGNRNIPVRVEDGEMGGMMHIRDNVINPILSQVDAAAFEFSQQVNAAHTVGVADGETSVGAIFDPIENASGAAGRIQINSLIKDNPDAIVGGLSQGPGDNRVALSIAAIGEKTVMPEFFGGQKGDTPRLTLTESLNSTMGFLGAETQRERQAFESSDRIMSQLNNYRESVSGVSLEEEAINMIQYQHAFNAAAKATKVGDELLQTILNIKQ